MTTTKQKTNATKPSVKRITCSLKGCTTRFKQDRITDKFCSTDCATAHRNTSRRTTTETTIPRTNHFCVTLIDEALRAGHLEVFKNLKGDKAALVELYKVVTLRMRSNIVTGKNNYHVCHVAPVAHATRLGTFDARNLFVGQSLKNKAAGQVSTGAGEFVPRIRLATANQVHESESRTLILDRIIAYIGEPAFKAFVKEVKLKESARVETIAKIESLIDSGNPEHDKFAALVANTKATTQQLQAALQELSDKAVFQPKFSRTSEANLLVSEYTRHAQHREELQFLLPTLALASSPNGTLLQNTFLQEEHVQTLFDLLQGHDADEMQEEVSSLEYVLLSHQRKAQVTQQRIVERVEPVRATSDSLGFESAEEFFEWLGTPVENLSMIAPVEMNHYEACPF